jgi:hypothetical protein
MCAQAGARIIRGMTRPAPSSKVVLLVDRRGGPAASGPVPVRRYRLARLRVDGQAPASHKRFAHLARTYD